MRRGAVFLLLALSLAGCTGFPGGGSTETSFTYPEGVNSTHVYNLSRLVSVHDGVLSSRSYNLTSKLGSREINLVVDREDAQALNTIVEGDGRTTVTYGEIDEPQYSRVMLPNSSVRYTTVQATSGSFPVGIRDGMRMGTRWRLHTIFGLPDARNPILVDTLRFGEGERVRRSGEVMVQYRVVGVRGGGPDQGLSQIPREDRKLLVDGDGVIRRFVLRLPGGTLSYGVDFDHTDVERPSWYGDAVEQAEPAVQ